MRSLWKSYLKIFGWNTSLTFPYHHLGKYVLIIAPHTSNWDFIIGLAYRSLLGLNHVRFLGKKELFAFPFGYFFRKLGGIPVDRHHSSHMVDDAAKFFSDHSAFALALSPEGTRSRVEKLRTGFYYIADKAKVPIIMVALDWKNKTLTFGEPFMVGEPSKDFDHIMEFYRQVHGKYPENGLMDR